MRGSAWTRSGFQDRVWGPLYEDSADFRVTSVSPPSGLSEKLVCGISMTGAHTVLCALIKLGRARNKRVGTKSTGTLRETLSFSCNVSKASLLRHNYTAALHLKDNLYFKTVNFTQDAPSELSWPPSRAARLISVRRQTVGNTCREAVAVHRSACFGRRDNRMCSLASVSDLYTHGSRLQQAAGGRLAVIALPSGLLDLKPPPPRGDDQAKPSATKKWEQTRSVRHGYEMTRCVLVSCPGYRCMHAPQVVWPNSGIWTSFPSQSEKIDDEINCRDNLMVMVRITKYSLCCTSALWDSLDRLRAGAIQTREKVRGAHSIIPIAKCQDPNATLRLEKLLIVSWMIVCVHKSDEPGSGWIGMRGPISRGSCMSTSALRELKSLTLACMRVVTSMPRFNVTI